MEALVILSFVLLSIFPQLSAQLGEPYYQYIQLSLQVPKSRDPQSTLEYFPLHGFRPVNTSLSNPNLPLGFNRYTPIERCPQATSGPFFTSQLPQDLRTELKLCWMSIGVPGQRTMTDERFWLYEYSKHGQCTINEYPTPQDYFAMAVNLWHLYPVDKWFKNNGLQPKKDKPLQDFVAVISKEFGAIPWLTCYDNGKKLKEVGLCFLKSSSVNANPAPTSCPIRALTYDLRCNYLIQYDLGP
uniref:ribonuclease Phyb-like n=1 Tax=Fragaria vesca subsp. vesca TaxID=101020 RepID=UPI0005C90222|nr:PREDICTED: ribonuclease Phyb-like [Fragaria vesca subsp. vesca]